MTLNFSDLLNTVSGAAKLMGKGGSGDTLSKVAKVWGEFKKYPSTMEGIQKALADYGVTEEQATTVMGNINNNPQLKALIEDKVPGSMNAILTAIKTKGASAPSETPHNTPHSENVRRLLAASARK